MTLFEMEILRDELLTRLDDMALIDEVKAYVLGTIIKKTSNMQTLEQIKVFFDQLFAEKEELSVAWIHHVKHVYEQEEKKLMKNIEGDYRKLQEDELSNLMKSFS